MPRHAKTPGYVRLNLGPQAQYKSAIAKRIQIMSQLRRAHRVSRKSNGNRSNQFDSLGDFCSQGQRQKRIVIELSNS